MKSEAKSLQYNSMGNLCKRFREECTECTQKDIAKISGYSKENVSAFECGRNNNARILLAYIGLGLLNYADAEELMEGSA